MEGCREVGVLRGESEEESEGEEGEEGQVLSAKDPIREVPLVGLLMMGQEVVRCS